MSLGLLLSHAPSVVTEWPVFAAVLSKVRPAGWMSEKQRGRETSCLKIVPPQWMSWKHTGGVATTIDHRTSSGPFEVSTEWHGLGYRIGTGRPARGKEAEVNLHPTMGALPSAPKSALLSVEILWRTCLIRQTNNYNAKEEFSGEGWVEICT